MTTPPELHGPMNESALAALDASLNGQAPERWNSFFADRARPCVFFGSGPDESLAEWVGDLTLPPGRAIDLGCGNGRNAIFLAARGFDVDAVDHSATAIAWARERASAAQVDVAWHCRSIFDLRFATQAHDLVVDSGCFHHVAPHRRQSYLATIVSALRPGGWFGLTCFRPEGGSGLSDAEVYERRSLGGGLGYTDEQLRAIFGRAFRVHALRTMREQAPDTGLFGQPFLWAMLAQKT